MKELSLYIPQRVSGINRSQKRKLDSEAGQALNDTSDVRRRHLTLYTLSRRITKINLYFKFSSKLMLFLSNELFVTFS
jgi:hypothetical protein